MAWQLVDPQDSSIGFTEQVTFAPFLTPGYLTSFTHTRQLHVTCCGKNSGISPRSEGEKGLPSKAFFNPPKLGTKFLALASLHLPTPIRPISLYLSEHRQNQQLLPRQLASIILEPTLPHFRRRKDAQEH